MTTATEPAPGLVSRYVWLWVFAVAMGWFEAAVVIYLRELYYPDGFRFPIVLASQRVAAVEIAREAASLLMIAAVARLAGRRFTERFAAFMLVFGAWDLLYYAFLWVILGWPASLAEWDVLFLIPLPWVAPVWAPIAVALALVGAGSRILLSREGPRALRALDWAIEIGAGLLIVASFLEQWHVVLGQSLPGAFASWLFWPGLLLGAGWFVATEARSRRAGQRAPPAPRAGAGRL